MKKLISLALACSFMMAAAVMPMTGAAAEMQVIDFSAAEGASYGGTIAADAATQNPCLAVAEDETASITFDETAATVDFKLKSADSAKPVTVTLGSDVLTFTGDAVTLGETPISFVAGLWYNLRVTAAGSGAVLYIDGVQMGTLAGTDAGFTALGISGAAYVDDVIAYTAADRYRPVTFTFSAKMPEEEDGYLRFCGRHANGPSGAANNNLTSDFEKNFIILEKGEIRAQQRSTNARSTLLGSYVPGEWNHFAVTYYPGMQTNRVDIRINGQFVRTSGNIPRAWSGALMLAGSAVKLQTIEEFILYYYNASDTAQPVGSTVLLDNFNVIAGYYDAPEQPSLSYSGTDLVIDNKEVIMFTAKTAVDLKAQLQEGANGTVSIYQDDSFTAEATGNVAAGNKIVVQKGDLFAYYTVTEPKLTITQRETVKNHRPILRLMAQLDKTNAADGTPRGNELQYIDKRMMQLLEDTEEQSRKLVIHNLVLRDAVFSRFLQNEPLSDISMEELLESVGISFTEPYFAVVFILTM